MVGFQNLKMSYYIILGMALNALIGPCTTGFQCTETINATCGSPADIVCQANTDIIDATLWRCNAQTVNCDEIKTCEGEIIDFLNWTYNPEKRMDRCRATLRIHQTQHNNSGTYCLFLKSQDNTNYVRTELTITGPCRNETMKPQLALTTDSPEPENVHKAVYVLLPIAGLILAMLVFLLRRRYSRQDAEKSIKAESIEENILEGNPSEKCHCSHSRIPEGNWSKYSNL